MKKAILYLRVSSDRQAKQDLSIPSQERICEEYAQKEGYSVEKGFKDEGRSARTDDRPAFLEAIDYARNRSNNISAIICYDTSRFARNREDAIVYKRLLKRAGVQVLFASQPIDQDSEGGFILEGILELFDEYYSRALGRQARRGLIEAAKKGYYVGGSAPYGFDTVLVEDNRGKHSRLIVNRHEADIVRKVFDLYNAGNGYTSIKGILDRNDYLDRRGKHFSRRAVEIMISNPIYTGDKVFGRSYGYHKRTSRTQEDIIRISGYCEPIIDQAVWDEVQEKRRSRDKGRVQRESDGLIFSGMLYCAKHREGLKISGGTSKTGKVYYYYTCPVNGCKLRISAKSFEEFLVDKILNHVLSEHNIRRLVSISHDIMDRVNKNIFSEKKRTERQLQDIDNRIKHLISLFEKGIEGEELMDRYEELKALKKSMQIKSDDTELIPPTEIPKEHHFQEFRKSIQWLYKNAPPRTLRSSLEVFVDRILVGEDEVEVIYRADLPTSGSRTGQLWRGRRDWLVNSRFKRK